MNVIEVANAGLAGFLLSLILLDGMRRLAGRHWPVQGEGLQFERRLLPWLIALIAGPALLWDQSRPYRRRRRGTAADLALLLVLIGVWSASYGISLGWLVSALA